MARTYWRNSDGLKVQFGIGTEPYSEKTAARDDSYPYKTLICDFTYNSLPSKNANDTDTAFLKAGSVIVDAWLLVDQAFVGGGTDGIDIGLVRADGTTAIDQDGILKEATQGTEAVLTAGAIVKCDGAFVPGRYVAGGAGDPANDPVLPVPVSIGANDGYIYATANGTLTAGSARLVVKYIEPFTAVVV